jgi:hypothetical protein
MPHKTRNPFREIFDSEAEMLPMEQWVAEDPRVLGLTRRILGYHERLRSALGGDVTVWLDLEALLNEREAVFEEAYFNSGFEHGFAAGEAEALRALTSGGEARYRVLADHIRGLVLDGGVSREATVAALLENAWALAVQL